MTYTSDDGESFETEAECLAWENGGKDAAEQAEEEARKAGRLESLKNSTADLVGRLLYYDRKEDEDLSREDIDEMLASGEVTREMILGWFSAALDEGMK